MGFTFTPRRFCCFFILLNLLLTGPAAARNMAPAVPQTPGYAPTRLLVQFTPEAVLASQLASLQERGKALPDLQTGLPAIDRLLAEVGAVQLKKSFGWLANRSAETSLGIDRWFQVEVPAGTDIPKAVARFAAAKEVAAAAPDWRVSLTTTPQVPNDPLYAANWGHRNTGQAPSYNWTAGDYSGPTVGMPDFDSHTDIAWGGDQGFGSASVVIAILDTGVDPNHPDLRQVPGYDYGDGDSNPDDDSAAAGHGTLCAGIAAGIADNSLGVAGAAGGCSIMPLKVADSAGNLYLTAVQNALHFAADNGANVVSMSWGLNLGNDPATDAALQYADLAGVVLVGAVGNENAPTIIYPANTPWVIAVGAASPCGERKRSSSNPAELATGVFADPNSYTCDGERWWGSNYSQGAGPDMANAVDFMGPTILPSTDISGAGGWDSSDYYAYFGGTSCAAPYVAGVCALFMSHLPGATPDVVRTQLVMTAIDMSDWVEATPGWDQYTGYGLVNAAAVVDASAVTADFSTSTTTPCVGQAVAFSDLSTANRWPLAAWQWDFGDGGLSTLQNPTWTYSQPGTYSVTLTVMAPDVMGYQWYDMAIKTDLVTVPAAVQAQMAVDRYFGDVPLTVQFTDTSVGNPVSWFWDFGDGATSTAQSPQHTYTTVGQFGAILTVNDACGTSTTLPFDIYAGVPSGVGPVPKVRFGLLANHPDPFNPATVLEFSLDHAGQARLDVFDVAGRRVAELLNTELGAGPHTLTWRPRQLQSGIYFARLVQGDRVSVERMVLLQ